MSKTTQLAIFVGVIALAAAIEMAVLMHRRRRVDVRDSLNSIAVGVGFLGIKMIGAKMLLLPVYLWVYQNARIFDLSITNPLTWIACWVVADFVAYWTHRGEHRSRGLWASHSVHHSSEQFTMTTAVRMPWTEVFYKPIIAFWAPLLGFHPAVHAIIGGLILAVGQLQHTEAIGRMGIFDRFLMTPSNHRVHHASNKVYLDKNFGATSVIWDKTFGTYQAELDTVKPVYGLTHATSATTPLGVATEGVRNLITDLKHIPSARGRFQLFFGRP
jgi:sterol desaturase/sphingolipid hydroxylase (fatty acid hydroxylase superfamily)